METIKNRILVVDDDEIILFALTESLSHQGYEIVALSNPLEALEVLREKEFAVIISDQRMAEMNGLDFLAQCKVIQPYASRILITGVQNIKTLIQAVNKSEIFRFVGKPWIREDLLIAIQNAIDQYLRIAKIKRRSEEQERIIDELKKEISALKAAQKKP